MTLLLNIDFNWEKSTGKFKNSPANTIVAATRCDTCSTIKTLVYNTWTTARRILAISAWVAIYTDTIVAWSTNQT